MDLFRTQTIRQQVAISTIVILLPIVAGAAWASVRSRRERAAEVRQEAASVASASAAYFDQYIRGLDSLASALVQHPAVVSMQREECDRLFATILHEQPLLLNIVLHAPDGAIRGSALPTDASIPLSAVPHVPKVMATRHRVVGDLTVGAITQKPTVRVGYPVRASGAIAGVLTFGLNLASLQSTFAAIPLSEGSIVTLTNQNRLILARSRDADKYIGTTADVPGPGETSSDQSLSRTDVDGVERVVASATVHGGPWVMSVGVPASVIAARLWPTWWRILAITLAGTPTLITHGPP